MEAIGSRTLGAPARKRSPGRSPTGQPDRSSRVLRRLGVGLSIAWALTLACQSRDVSPPVDPDERAPVASTAARRFDGARALADLTRLEQIGERPTGSRGAGKARSFIRRSLRRADFEAQDVDTKILIVRPDGASTERDATHVVGWREGASRDVILLVAPYDTPGDATATARLADMADAASGASVLLELARVDREAREASGVQPFTLVLAFVDGDGLGQPGSGTEPARASPGSDAFGRWWLEEHADSDVRLVVFVDRVGEGRVEVARDLHSSRVYREAFFAAGAERDLEPAFVVDRPLSAPAGGHRAFQALGLKPVVALVGDGARVAAPTALTATPARAGLAAAEPGAGGGEDGLRPSAPSASSLGAVGEGAWWGLVRISDRLARIDAFRADPLAGGPASVELPGASERSEPPEGPEAAASGASGSARP